MFGRIHLWERLAWLGVTVCLLLTSLITAGVSRSGVKRAVEKQETAMQEVGQLRTELQQARSAAEVKTVPDAGTSASERALPQGDVDKVPAELRQLLIADLQKHHELIPHPGVLGGKMGFYDTQGIRILGPKWVLADFEDGHIDGQALLAYRVTPDGRVNWRLLDSYLNE